MSHTYWYATRGTGVAALILLTLVVTIGIAGSLRLRSERWPRFLVVGLHRNLTLLTLVFLALHIVTTVLDSFTPIRLQDAFIPFAAQYRPIWLGLGAVAFDLLLALTITSLLRARVGYRRWRALHWLAYAAWPIALAHGLGTGSDARFGWLQLLSVACVLSVLVAVLARILRAATPPARRGLAVAGAVLVVIVGAVWYSGGPATRGWAARAGTPSKLLGHKTAAIVAPPRHVTPVVQQIVAVPFTGRLTGRLTTTNQADGLVRVDIRGRIADKELWIRLRGEPTVDGGVQLTASGVHFGRRGDPNRYVGSVRELQGTQIGIALHDANGHRIRLAIALQIDQSTGAVTGIVRAEPGAGASE